MKTIWRTCLPVWITGVVLGCAGSALGASEGTRIGSGWTRPDPGSGMVEVNRVDRMVSRSSRLGAMPETGFRLASGMSWVKPSPVTLPTEWPRTKARVFHTAAITTPPEFPEPPWAWLERRHGGHGHRAGGLPGKVHPGITDAAAERARHEHGPVVGRTGGAARSIAG